MARAQQNRRHSSTSNDSAANNIIDSLMSSLYKFKDLEKASIPELREIERRLLSEA